MSICISVRPDLIDCQGSQKYQEFWSFSAKLLQSLLDLTIYKIYKINSIPAANDENIEVNKTDNQSCLNMCLWHDLVIDIRDLFQYFSAVFNQLWTHTAMILSGKLSLSVSGKACRGVLLTSHIHLTTEGINLSWQTTLYLFKFASLFLQSPYTNSAWLSIRSSCHLLLRSSLDIFLSKSSQI